MNDWTIEIDLGDMAKAERATDVDMAPLTAAIRDAAEYVRQLWGSAVQGVLLPGMTRMVVNDDYYEGLFTGDSLRMITPLHGAVICLYQGIDRIEQGYGSFDMKPGLLNGPSSRPTRYGGRYNTVPFRHMTPEKGQIGAGRRPHGTTMPPDVYKIVKRDGRFLDPGDPERGEQIGQRSKLAGQINLQALARGQDPPMRGNYTWKYGLYHGMRKVSKTYARATQSQYLTWRTVSSKSDPSSWIHPGIGPNPLIQAVIDAARPQVIEMVMAGARAAFGGSSD